MVTLMAANDEKPQAESWRTVQTIIVVGGIAVSLVLGGMRVGGLSDVSEKLQVHQQYSEQTYVRKDGQDLERIRGELRLLNEKIDRLLQNEGLTR